MGPLFHRGRLDGSARVLVVGQDPAQHESVTRRILVGAAGQRTQGFLARLGIDSSYVMVNAFLCSVFGQGVEVAFQRITHPTAPESSAGGDPDRYAEAVRSMLQDWNTGLERLRPAIRHPDVGRDLVPDGEALTSADYARSPGGTCRPGCRRGCARGRGRTVAAARPT